MDNRCEKSTTKKTLRGELNGNVWILLLAAARCVRVLGLAQGCP